MSQKLRTLEQNIALLRVENKLLKEEKRVLTEELAYLKKALQDSSRDDLTGMLRRTMFQELADEHLCILRRHPGRSLSLLVVDLNNLKTINDRYGHPAGDKVLIAFANLLNSSLRDGDLIARGSAGGDEFLVLLPEQNEKGADAARLHLLEEFEEYKKVILPAFFGAAVGAATVTAEEQGKLSKTFDDLYQEADEAMYKNKRLLKEQEEK